MLDAFQCSRNLEASGSKIEQIYKLFVTESNQRFLTIVRQHYYYSRCTVRWVHVAGFVGDIFERRRDF